MRNRGAGERRGFRLRRCSALARRCGGGFHMAVNCQPARPLCLPVLVPAQAVVRAGERRGKRGMRNSESGRVSGVEVLLTRFALGSRLTLRLCRGVLPRFTPDFVVLSARVR